MLIQFQTVVQELFRNIAQILGTYNCMDGLVLYLLQQLLLIFGPPRRIIGEHLIEDDPDGPNICLERVLVLLEGLGRHI